MKKNFLPIIAMILIPTDSKGQFEVLARFYGPEKALYDKSWKMGDIEEVK